MGERYLYQKCPFLKEVSQERREQFETYFRTAPDWLIDAFVVEKEERIFLLMNGTDRLCLLLVNHYEQYQKKRSALCKRRTEKSGR